MSIFIFMYIFFGTKYYVKIKASAMNRLEFLEDLEKSAMGEFPMMLKTVGGCD